MVKKQESNLKRAVNELLRYLSEEEERSLVKR